jgi:hypothetical protein
MNAPRSLARVAGLVLRPVLGEARPRASREFRPGPRLELMEDRVVPTITDFNILPFIPPGNNFAYQYPDPSPILPAPVTGVGPVLLPKPGNGQIVTPGNVLSTVAITNNTNSPLAIAMAIYNSPTGEAQGGTHHNLTAHDLRGYTLVILAPKGQPGDTATLSIDVSKLKLNGDAGERAFEADVVSVDLALAQSVLGSATTRTVYDVKKDPLVTDDSRGLTTKIGNGNNDFYFLRELDGELYNNSDGL